MPKEKKTKKYRTCPACPGSQYLNIYSHIKATHRLHSLTKALKKKPGEQEYAHALAMTLRDNNLPQAKQLLHGIKDDKPNTKTVRCKVCKSKCSINVTGLKKHLSIFHAFHHLLQETTAHDFFNLQSTSDVSLRQCGDIDVKFSSDNDSVTTNPVVSPRLEVSQTTRIILKPAGLRLGARRVNENNQKVLAQDSSVNESLDIAPNNPIPTAPGNGTEDRKHFINDSMPTPIKKVKMVGVLSQEKKNTQLKTSTVQSMKYNSAWINENKILETQTNNFQSIDADSKSFSTADILSTQVETQNQDFFLQEETECKQTMMGLPALHSFDSALKLKPPFEWETPRDSPKQNLQIQFPEESTEIKVKNETNLKCCACSGSLFLNLDNHIIKKHKITNNDEESKNLEEALKTNNLTEARLLIWNILNSLPDKKKIQCNYCNHILDAILFRMHLSGFHNLNLIITSTESNTDLVQVEPVLIDLTQDDIKDEDLLEEILQTNLLNRKTFGELHSLKTDTVKTECASPDKLDYFITPCCSPQQILSSDDDEPFKFIPTDSNSPKEVEKTEETESSESTKISEQQQECTSQTGITMNLRARPRLQRKSDKSVYFSSRQNHLKRKQ